MNALTKLTAVALSVAGIVGGVAVAQTSNDATDAANTARPDTASVSLWPGSNLKRDSSLSSTPRPAPVVSNATNSSATTTTTQTTTQVTPPVPDTPVAVTTTTEAPAAAPVVEAMPPARADRN